MITPLCYFTANPKEGSSSNFNDPVSEKIRAVTDDTHMDLFFNRRSFSLMDSINKKVDGNIVAGVRFSVSEIGLFYLDNGNPMINNIIAHTVRTSLNRMMSDKFGLKFEDGNKTCKK